MSLNQDQKNRVSTLHDIYIVPEKKDVFSCLVRSFILGVLFLFLSILIVGDIVASTNIPVPGWTSKAIDIET